jgi:hypothetical protein
MKAARGMITATKRVRERVRERARAATWMAALTKRERATRVVGNKECNGNRRQQHGQWLRQR